MVAAANRGTRNQLTAIKSIDEQSIFLYTVSE